MCNVCGEQNQNENNERICSVVHVPTEINGRFSPSKYTLPLNPIDNIHTKLDHLLLSGSDSEGHLLVVDKHGNLRFNVIDDSLIPLPSSRHIILSKEWTTSSFDLYTGFIYDVAHLFEDDSFLYIGYDPRVDNKSEGTFLFRVSVYGEIIWKFRMEGTLKRMHSILIDKDENIYLFSNCNPKAKTAYHRFYKISSQGKCLIQKDLSVWIENCLFSQDGNIIAYVRQTRPSIDDEIFGEETYKLSLYNTSLELIHESQLQLAGKNGAYADLHYIPQIDCFGNLIYSIGNTLYSFDKNFDIRWQINEPGQVFLRTDSLILIKKVQEIVCIDLDGSIVWKKELTELPYQFRGALLVDKNNYFVCLFDSMFGNNTHAVCFSPKGEIVWKSLLNKKTYGEAAVLYDDGFLCFVYGVKTSKRKLLDKNRWNESLVIHTFIEK